MNFDRAAIFSWIGSRAIPTLGVDHAKCDGGRQTLTAGCADGQRATLTTRAATVVIAAVHVDESIGQIDGAAGAGNDVDVAGIGNANVIRHRLQLGRDRYARAGT